jgi:GNAT superfamily N-acetyltransferase
MESPAQHVWYVRGTRLDNGLHEVTAFVGAEHDDGTVVDVDIDDLVGHPHLWRAAAGERGVITVTLSASAAIGSPDLWFVNVNEPRSSPAATNLVAFASDHVTAGTIIDKFAFASLGVDNNDQAGAIRWYPGTGVIHQIFVAEKWRRQQVGTALLYTASAFHQANGWPGHLRADGRRTELGQRLAAALKHPSRVAPLSETMPPMDPAASADAAT